MRRRRAKMRPVQRDYLELGASQRGGLMSAFAMFVPAAAVVALGIALLIVLDLRPESGREQGAASGPVAAENPAVALPDFVLNSPAKTQEAYRFALERPEALQYIPCYCGCGPMGHESVRGCFLKQVGPDVVEFDEHAAFCSICVDIALDVKAQLARGKPLSEVRSYIDSRYADIGPGTDTPLPPGEE